MNQGTSGCAEDLPCYCADLPVDRETTYSVNEQPIIPNRTAYAAGATGLCLSKRTANNQQQTRLKDIQVVKGTMQGHDG
jgi:hypothetical protein